MIHAGPLVSLSELYHLDETGWLERMARLASESETTAMDLPHLAEYLSDMARRDKREVLQRLATLLVHLLKWEHQPEKRSRSWELTIHEQREELAELLESGTLRNYAEQELGKAYQKAVRRAVVETGLEETAFPEEYAQTVEQLLAG